MHGFSFGDGVVGVGWDFHGLRLLERCWCGC